MPRLRRTPIAGRVRARQLTLQTVERARRARRELALLIPLTIGVILAYVYRDQLFGVDKPLRVVFALVLAALGWALARDIGRFTAPMMFRRLDPSTAGTVGFIVRLAFLGLAVLVALRIAGLPPQTLAVGGAITAIVLGLAAQQTFGNVFAGLVLISARPFRVGERVRLQAGGVAGQVEGVVTALGLLYTTFSEGEDSILVPNSVVLSAAVVPLREPAGVDLRVRLRPDVKPSEVQALLCDSLVIDTRGAPEIALEELDSDEVVIRVTATPAVDADGPRLADEILSLMTQFTREGATAERELARRFTRSAD
jgi:small-conductance mechanosensitive channel